MSETRPVPAELPDYRRPPVVEIVAAVQFLPVPQFGMPEAVAVARELSDWRIVDAPPALPPIVEGEASRALQPAINLGLGTPPLRLILDSGNGRWLAQAQQDRVAVHERKSDAHGRPSFANVEPKLHDVAAAVSRALDRTILREGAPPELVELTYDNTIPVGDAWTSFAELDRVLCGLASSAGKPPYDRPEQISVAFSYVLARDEQFVGRLLVVAGPRFDDDGDLALHLRLISRRYVLERQLADVLADCHRDIVEGFTAVTTAKMHEVWERYR